MKQTLYTHSRSGIFLMEIIIAILFFSIVSAICLNIFVHTHNLSKSTADLNFAIREAANVAEIAKSADSFTEATQLLTDTQNYTEAKSATTHYIAYFGENYQTCTSADALYYIDVTAGLSDATVSSSDTTLSSDTVSSDDTSLSDVATISDDIASGDIPCLITWHICVYKQANTSSDQNSDASSSDQNLDVSSSGSDLQSDTDTALIYELTSEVYYAK